jgi:hypothetical protein
MGSQADCLHFHKKYVLYITNREITLKHGVPSLKHSSRAGAEDVFRRDSEFQMKCVSADWNLREAERTKMGDATLRELTRNYALRAREFSDSVARLGRFGRIGPDFIGAMEEVEKFRALCLRAGDELSQHIDAQGRGSRRDTAGQP